MGGGSWTRSDWDSFKSTTAGKSTAAIFDALKMPDGMDPRKITVRESRDSKDNPNSTPIILALDGTGSMGEIAGILARDGLGTLVQQILDRKPVSDPHIMAMCVGDAWHDDAPLQVTQFEADKRIAGQLKELYLEGGGGGNSFESYNLPWYFAAQKTELDCLARGKKGLLFTFGDERCPSVLEAAHIRRFIGDNVQADISTKDLLAMVEEKYDVFHVVVEQTNNAQRDRTQIYASWNAVLPQGRIIPLKDHTKVAEVIVSVMEVHAGKDKDAVAKSWDGSTGLVVANAVKDMKQELARTDEPGAVWRPSAGGLGRP